MKTKKINHFAVWISIILFQVLSTLWYSPALFADRWLAHLGKKIEDFDGESIDGLIYSFLGAILFNYLMAWLLKHLQINSGIKGLALGFLFALACFVFPTFTQDSFSLRPAGLSVINSGIILINFGLSGLLLGSWTKYEMNKSVNV